jgi:hypothetical protein
MPCPSSAQIREFAFRKEPGTIRAALLLGARVVPYEFLPAVQDGGGRQYDGRSVALHKHRGSNQVVYQYLLCPDLPFEMDHFLAVQATCRALLLMYAELEALVRQANNDTQTAALTTAYLERVSE